MSKTKKLMAVLAAAGFVATAAFTLDVDIRIKDSRAEAATTPTVERSPIKGVPESERNAYNPGTEDLGPDEMRIVGLGTGMPSARPKQASACWLVELGNGDKFLFDLGAGCHERIAAQKIPYDYLDKVFISHLHVDHYGDLAGFWLGGTTMNRLTPLRVWGPSGTTPEYGTQYAMDMMEKMYTWDVGTRSGFIDFRGGALEVHEFPFEAVNSVIFEENGVVIRSIPAIHGIDGAVSFVLEWNGLKFVYGGDTFPNKWFVEHAKDADVAVHECMMTPELYIKKQGFTPAEALTVGTQVHTSPQQFGKVMSLVKPRMAVAYHFYNDFDTQPAVLGGIRETYSGPVALAQDYMVFNVTKDADVRVRMSAIDEEVWPSPALRKKEAPDRSKLIPYSDFTKSGALPMSEIMEPMFDRINKKYGTKVQRIWK
ncbi:MAG: MBL fold metallo-hydrolase [Deltaproteobacteria bacterium]|nr:MBL fold metallo-hydrolase [Deltaproteobacteria bacterium]